MMPPFDAFAHYLAYGATDQETFRQLRHTYDGVLVPGTIAAWQRQGTGGFVLSLSATTEAPPYMIDPRFPLFQQGLLAPKQSHAALANLLGDPELIRASDPTPDMFPRSRLGAIARCWVEFNKNYGYTSNEKFEKYAERLGEALEPEQAQGPEAVLAPYFVASGPRDPWWERSVTLFEESRDACQSGPCIRVVCALTADVLGPLLEAVQPAEQLAVWISGLDEHNASAGELTAYLAAIAQATDRGHAAFALYGGFFSVLLGTLGLSGASHGVGFSEHRSWRELPESGAPPARYYLRRAHRYVPQDLAQILWQVDPALTECPCDFCAGREPVALDYHDLMKHSVWCRDEEIKQWFGNPAHEAATALLDEHSAMTVTIRSSSLPPRLRARALASIEHLLVWNEALTQ